MAQDQVEDEDLDLSQDQSSEGGDFESADGGGTEVVASGEDVEESEEEVVLEAAPGVKTTAIFPKATREAYANRTPLPSPLPSLCFPLCPPLYPPLFPPSTLPSTLFLGLSPGASFPMRSRCPSCLCVQPSASAL